MRKRLPGLEKVKLAIREFKLINEEGKVLVGFSGGADSTYCLLALMELGFDVKALHINHGLRETAKRDEEWCINFCKTIGVDAFVERIKIEGHTALEEMGRKKRYEIFRRYAKEYGFNAVALGHNLTDAFETFLFNSLRGSGLMGLVLPPKAEIFIRPLILMCREEIREYLRDAGYEWVEDESNLSDKFSRNRIRMYVEPNLHKIFPNWCDRFANTYINLWEEREYFQRLLEEFSDKNLIFTGGAFALRISEDIRFLRTLSRILDVEIKPLRQIFYLKNGKCFVIKNWKIYRFNDFFVGFKREAKLEDLNLKVVEGEGRYTGRVKGLGEIILRFRKVGDAINSKRLGEIFYKKKIPTFLRDFYPIVEINGKIAWIPFVYEEGGEVTVGLDRINPKMPDFFDILRFMGLI
ncbi:MAG: tRNA lysidine(34) synthetase TilS [candidate division WOR-3 bacterium]